MGSKSLAPLNQLLEHFSASAFIERFALCKRLRHILDLAPELKY
jgi:hypothetical protein